MVVVGPPPPPPTVKSICKHQMPPPISCISLSVLKLLKIVTTGEYLALIIMPLSLNMLVYMGLKHV